MTTDSQSVDDAQWWKESVVYQVYPKSFNDTDGDGIGDLPGIIEKVDYLADLRVDVIWLNPVYASPMADNGYDIADYRAIHPAFGTMDDWERLLEELHDRDMRLIMDLVVNHTSDEHEWFIRSREGDPEYDEYYYWQDTDERPNNWESFFGRSAWSYDETRDEYYLHLFDEKQPDLNWRNEAVRQDVFEMMRWWLEKGIDGFRMDVINLISKTEGLPDGTVDGEITGAEHFVSGPQFKTYLTELVTETVGNYDVITVGEMIGVDAEEAQEYVGEDGLSMLIHFEHMGVDTGEDGKWDVATLDLLELKRIITDWQETLADGGWNCLYLSNHDQPRAVSRFGHDEEFRRESAKMLATFLFTLQGTPFIYQGQEIGMTNASFAESSQIRDVEAQNFVENALDSDAYESYEEVRPIVESRSRDNTRTPMQWSNTRNAGFSEGEPWIGVNEDYETVNVEAARDDSDSVWHYYRDLIDLREALDVFVYGEYDLLLPDHTEVFAYRRALADDELIVICNFFDSELSIDLPQLTGDETPELLIGNYEDTGAPAGDIDLRPYEARIYKR